MLKRCREKISVNNKTLNLASWPVQRFWGMLWARIGCRPWVRGLEESMFLQAGCLQELGQTPWCHRLWLLLLAQPPPPGAMLNLPVAPKCLVGRQGCELVPEQDYSWDLVPEWWVIAFIRQALSMYKHRVSLLLIIPWCPFHAIAFLLHRD